MGKFNNLKPGDLVWCVIGENDYMGYLFMAVCSDYVIVCSEYMQHAGCFEHQLVEMRKESAENMWIEAYLFRKDDVYLTEDEAREVSGRISASRETLF